jgi:glyoxylase-like metal-dependent hydrolase (beta-lactamase superfamily II)
MSEGVASTPADRWTTLVTRVLAPNPGPMTLEGTNSLVIGAPGQGVVVVDPGPDDAAHLERLAGFGTVELVLLTHHHGDHTEGAEAFRARTGAPVRAIAADLTRGAEPLVDGEQIRAGGTVIRVIATPGHTADSVSFHLPDDTALETTDGEAPAGAAGGGTMITGDTILGRGTTIIADPDGSLGAYLGSLETLNAYGRIPVLPAHGPLLPDLSAVCGEYLAHRQTRLGHVRDALASLGRPPADDPALVTAVVDLVYRGIHPSVRFAAEASTRAQLQFLATDQSWG